VRTPLSYQQEFVNYPGSLRAGRGRYRPGSSRYSGAYRGQQGDAVVGMPPQQILPYHAPHLTAAQQISPRQVFRHQMTPIQMLPLQMAPHRLAPFEPTSPHSQAAAPRMPHP
jgi:hypothetical protein